MKDNLMKIAKFYASIIMSCIGVFIFLGILNTINNFYPIAAIHSISEVILTIVLPVLIAYLSSSKISDHQGGIIGALGVLVIIVADTPFKIIGAFVVGSLAGLVTKKLLEQLFAKIPSGFELLGSNLIIGITALFFNVISWGGLIPALDLLGTGCIYAVDYLIGHELLPLIAIIIEPAKVFFLNNLINHGILVPIGLSQVAQEGDSMLFFLETNPGPGAGVLIALAVSRKREMSQMFSYSLVEFFGGIHEVYFPIVLEFKQLFISLIIGGMAGIITMERLAIGLTNPISPGSVITIILGTNPQQQLMVIIPIVTSFLVALISALVLLQVKKNAAKQVVNDEVKLTSVDKVVFTCDGGFGSSVMGASLFKRKMRKYGFAIEVVARAVDNIDADGDIIVCQDGFQEIVKRYQPDKEIYLVREFLDNSGYQGLIELIKERND